MIDSFPEEQKQDVGAFSRIESISNPDDANSERMTVEERLERKEVALRAVMDGTFEGTVYDSASLALGLGMKSMIDSSYEIIPSPTSFKDKLNRPIVEVVVLIKDHMDRELSRKAVGYMVSDDSEKLDNIVKFN